MKSRRALETKGYLKNKMAKYIINPCDQISLTEKVFLSAVVREIDDKDISGYIKYLIRHSVVTCREVTFGCGIYVYFETFVLPKVRKPVPPNMRRMWETKIADYPHGEPGNFVYLMLYLNQDKTALDFLEITIAVSTEEPFDEWELAHMIMDKCFRAT